MESESIVQLNINSSTNYVSLIKTLICFYLYL